MPRATISAAMPATAIDTAWVKFTLSGINGGNRKVSVTEHSECASPGLCGVGSPNR